MTKTQYFDRGNHVVEIITYSPGSRDVRYLPKPHTLGNAGPTPQLTHEPRVNRIPTKRRIDPEVQKAAVEEQRRRLGDKLESALTGIGLSQENYVAIKEELGLPPTCDCPARKEWINKVDAKYQISEKIDALKGFMGWK
jgi:hypothetical protein